MTIDALRTPDERFEDLPDFPFAPRFLEELAGYDGLRMAYLDEGPREAAHTFLCLHGEPTWSFLYRKMIPVFLQAGHRVVAPDFFGFGRSDKPVQDELYTFGFHRDALIGFIERLDLRRLTLVLQDWGGLLGLTLPMELPDRCQRLLLMNTALATGVVPPSDGFLAWKRFVASQPDLAVGRLMLRAVPGISERDAAAYDAPFPDSRYKAGVRRFPAIVPVTPQMEGAELGLRAAQYLQRQWQGPVFAAVGAQDPVLGVEVMTRLAGLIRGCPEPLVVDEAGHFLQEHGAEVARRALAHFGD